MLITCNRLQQVVIALHEPTNLVARILFKVLINILAVPRKCFDRVMNCFKLVWRLSKVIVEA